MKGETLEAAASAAGMSERSARKWQDGAMPSATKKPRTWRTRPDPFAETWAAEIEPLLIADEEGRLEAKTIMEELVRRKVGVDAGQLRTLQRRIRQWRAECGPEKEVMFPQEHAAGRMAAFDFTHATELAVTIAGVVLVHLWFELVFAFSGFRFVQLAFGETYEALLSGLQRGLIAAGGVPEVVRHDNLSAATRELVHTRGRALNERFAEVVDHYGFRSSRIRAGEGHENGVAEQAHNTLKSAINQALLLRGHRDFPTVAAYVAFVERLVEEKFHEGRAEKIAIERAALRPLPATRLPEYTRARATVRSSSTISIARRIYSVPSRLIGREVEVRVHPDILEVRLVGGTKVLETMPRLRGDAGHRIDYRHVVWSLVKKPGAFAAYRFREELFPTVTFRRAYDALRTRRGERADVEYLRILHLAASTTERDVEAALVQLLADNTPFDYADVKSISQPREAMMPNLDPRRPDFSQYDELLLAAAEAAS